MKKIALIMALIMALLLAACGNSAEVATQETEAPVETQAPQEEEVVEEEAAPAEATVDVGAEYPVSTQWAEYAIMPYYFEETDETVDIVVSTNEDHDTFEVHFTFFGDEQKMTFTNNNGTLEVLDDLSGFMTKDVEKLNAAIAEITEWTAVPAEGAAVAEETVDVGAEYPVSTQWAEYAIMPYYFEETDETVEIVVSTNEAHDTFEVHFTFFGDEQKMTFTNNNGTLEVLDDLSGFMTKDVEKLNTAIGEITEWTAVG